VNTSDCKHQKLPTITLTNPGLIQNILMVDDNPGSLRLVSKILSDRGYKVRPTRDAEMALKFARSNPPDLILLDVMMPKMNGYQICEELKSGDRTKDIPVIFISVLNEVFDKVKAFSVGAADYITKPFQIEELLARVENQLLLGRLSKQLLAQNARLQAEIEQREQIEAELRESQHWLSAVIKTNPNILYVCDLREQCTVYLNREIYSDIGYSQEEIQQMPAAFFPELMHDGDLPLFSEHRSKIELAKDGESFEFEYRIQHKNGEYKWFLSRETVFARTADNKPWKILGTATEISDRKQAELELKQAKKCLEQQIEQRFLLEKITQKIRSSLNPERVFQTAAAQIGKAFNVDRCLIHTYTEHPHPRIPCVAEYKIPESESMLDAEIPVRGNPHAEFVLSHDRAVVSDDVTADPLLVAMKDSIDRLGLKSMLVVRTSYQEKANGVICLHQYDRPRKWTQAEIELFEAVAAQMGIAIAQANLLEQEKQQCIKLQESEASLSAAQKIAKIGSWKYDVRSEKFTWSEEVFRIFGLDRAALEPTYPELLEMFHPEDREVLQQTVNHTLSTGNPYKKELIILHPSGKNRYLETRGKAIFDETGEAIQLLGTVMDITDRKQAELDLLHSEQREREKAQQLEQTLEELKRTQSHLIQAEKMSSIGQMVAGVAHEINNPIGFIYGNIIPASQYASDLLNLIQLYRQHYPKPAPEIAARSEEIDADFIAADFPKILASMKEGANRIKQIVLSLRNFSRLDEKERKVVDIHEGIESTLLMLQHRLKEPRKYGEIQVIKEYGKLPLIECYPAQLNQVFMNILLNAIDALEEPSSSSNGKPLEIRIATEIICKNRVGVRIADSGPGICTAIMPKIFDPFFTTKDVGSGTGLGLSIGYQIVKDKHGGELKCYSEVGRGTEFAIELPISQKNNKGGTGIDSKSPLKRGI
jgi:PAS domain S-box-containing protein